MNPTPTTEAEARDEQEVLARLLKRAEQGDRAVLLQLRAALDANSSIWQSYGDLAAHAEASLIELAAGPNLLMALSLQRRLKALKDELGGESPSALDRLLAERVAACWLQASFYDGLLAQAREASEGRLRMLQRLQDAAHRRFLAAAKTLAVVKKLLKSAPSPVEIASRMGGPGPAARRGGVAVAGAVPAGN